MRIAMKKLGLLVALLGLCTTGCEAACNVIKTAADVCNMVEYTGEDGKTYQVKLTQEQVEGMAMLASEKEGMPAPKGKNAAAPAPTAAPVAPPVAPATATPVAPPAAPVPAPAATTAPVAPPATK